MAAPRTRRTAWPVLTFLALLPEQTRAAPVPVPEGLAWRDPAPTIPETAPLPSGAVARLGRRILPVTLHAFSPDGRFFATTHASHFATLAQFPIHLWDAVTGKHLRVLAGHPTGVLCAAFSPDGSILASGGMDDTLRFWDTATAKQLGASHPHNGHVHAVCFTPDGKQLVSTSEEVRFWDTRTGKDLRRFQQLRGGREFINLAVISPDNKTLATGSEQHIRLWDIATGRETHTLEDNITAYYHQLAFSADGQTLISNGWPKALLRKWDVATGKRRGEAGNGTTAPMTVAFSRDGRKMLWVDGPTDKRRKAPEEPWVRALVVSETAGGKELCRIGSPGEVFSFAFSPDGKSLAGGSVDGSLRFWSATSGKLLRTCLEGTHPVSALFTGAGNRSLISLTRDGTQHDWGLAALREHRQRRLSLPAKSFLPASAAGDKCMAIVEKDGTLHFWNLLTGRERWSAPRALKLLDRDFAPKPVRLMPPARRDARETAPDVMVAVSADGRTVAGLTGDGSQVTVWDAEGKKRKEVKVLETLDCLALSPDGKNLYLAESDGERGEKKQRVRENSRLSVRAWDLAVGKEIGGGGIQAPAPMPGFSRKSNVACLVPSPDGRALAVVEQVYSEDLRAPGGGADWGPSGDLSWRIHLWETDGKRAPRPVCPEGSCLLAFSADGKLLAFASQDDVAAHGYGVAIHDLARGKTCRARSKDLAAMVTLAFLPDGKTLASGSDDATILLWDVAKLMREAPPEKKPADRADVPGRPAR
jgi:WD40 repeat protein